MNTTKTHPNSPFPLVYDKPKSICGCGHTGDGPNSMHADLVQRGHGHCIGNRKGRKCQCERFTWDHWTARFAAILKRNTARMTRKAVPA